MIPGVPRSAPPSVPPPIEVLMRRDPNINPNFVMDNAPVYKPLSKRRQVNAMWRHYSFNKRKLSAPLEPSEIQKLEEFATSSAKAPRKTDFHVKLENELRRKRCLTGKFQGRFHRMSSRFLRRRYQHLLASQNIPVISESEGSWRVTQGPKRLDIDKFPRLDPQFLEGYTLPCGTKVGQVDEKGAFVKQSG